MNNAMRPWYSFVKARIVTETIETVSDGGDARIVMRVNDLLFSVKIKFIHFLQLGSSQ
jgi:hypothetical protein